MADVLICTARRRELTRLIAENEAEIVKRERDPSRLGRARVLASRLKEERAAALSRMPASGSGWPRTITIIATKPTFSRKLMVMKGHSGPLKRKAPLDTILAEYNARGYAVVGQSSVGRDGGNQARTTYTLVRG